MFRTLKSRHVWVSTDPVEENVRRVLPQMAREYFNAGRKIVDSKPKPAALHPFRLLTKRFRYTLESFAQVYGSSLDGKLDLLKPVQDALGDVNDCIATADEFDAGKKFSRYLHKRALKKADRFFEAWRQTFDAPGQEAVWLAYLEQIPVRGDAAIKPSSSRRPRPTLAR